MRGVLLAYSAGILAGTVLLSAHNPPLMLLAAGASGLICLGLAGFAGGSSRRQLLYGLGALCLGLGWHSLWAQQRLAQLLPAQLEGSDVVVSGRIDSLVRRREPRQSFQFRVETGPGSLPGRRLALNYYGEQSLVAGQYWRFGLRLNRPHGFANPGSFDYEARLMQQKIIARGYVRELIARDPERDSSLSVLGWRESLRTRLLAQEGLRQTPVLLALVLGEQSLMSAAQWELFSATGSNHLFVISGLHVGLVAFAAYYLTLFAGRFLPLPLLPLARPQLAAMTALAAAFGYCLLAGFALPAQRAFVMLGCFMAGKLLRRAWPVSLRFLLALAVILTLNPLAALNRGFWFSFVAVAWLLAFAANEASSEGRGRIRSYLVLTLRTQLLVFVGLMAPLALMTGQVSLIAPLVNLLAIPLLGLLIVPLALVGTVLLFLHEGIARWLLLGADAMLTMLLATLDWAAGRLPEAVLGFLPAGPVALLLAILACLLLSLPRLVPARVLALPLLLPMLWPRFDRPPPDSFEVHFLDVGQGLAVLIRTHSHVLLYDTGDRFSEDFDLGQAAVTPALRQFGISRIDTIVVSHGDDDHAGGLRSLLTAFESGRLLFGGSDPVLADLGQPCVDGQSWDWDGVGFAVLAPADTAERSDENNSSCVLQVSVGGQSLLLPGDIQQAGERALVMTQREALASRLLAAPHHGSKTSSGYPLLKAVAADHIIVSAGYRNAFGHPAPTVLARYAAFDAAALVTAKSGMISFTLAADGSLGGPVRYRLQRRRYWRL